MTSYAAMVAGSSSGNNQHSTPNQNQNQTQNPPVYDQADQTFLNQVNDLNSPLNLIHHPLYLHLNDNPGLILITKKLLELRTMPLGRGQFK